MMRSATSTDYTTQNLPLPHSLSMFIKIEVHEVNAGRVSRVKQVVYVQL